MGVHTDTDNPGSLLYLPPEALKNAADSVMPSWDIWAIAGILYVMVCGKLPFNGRSEKMIKRAIKS